MLQGLTPAVYAAPETAKRADAFVETIGVNVHLNYLDTAYGNYTGIIKPKLQELGVRYIRDGGYQDLTFFNKLKELGTLGIKSFLYFNGNPPAQVVSTAKTLQGALAAVEGPNESDIPFFEFSYNGQGFPEGTRAYQNALFTAINSDPATASVPVLMPSMGHGEAAQRLGSLEGSGDIGNMHSYTNLGNPPTNSIEDYFIYHARTIAGPTKPLMATEMGYHTYIGDNLGISESVSAKYIPRLLLEYFNADIKRAFLYELIEQQPERNTDRESYYGLLRSNGSPKPAYTAVKNLIYLLKQPGAASFTLGSLDYTLSGNTTDVHHALFQKSAGSGLPPRFFLVLWQEVKSWDNTNKRDINVPNRKLTLTLNTPISQASFFLPISSTASLLDVKPTTGTTRITSIPIEVPDHPMVIRLIP